MSPDQSSTPATGATCATEATPGRPRKTGEPWAEPDVDADIELEREYGDRVPVILLDGKEHGYWRVEEDRLLRDLGRRRATLTRLQLRRDAVTAGRAAEDRTPRRDTAVECP